MNDDEKRLAAEAAVAEVEDGMLVGLGTGSTAAFAVRRLGARVAQGLRVRAVATSRATEDLARASGIAVLDFADVPRLDVTVDGADEIDPRFFAIKGGGGAMLREKVVAAASDRMIVVADSSKRVPAIGARPVPVEVLPFARASLLAILGDQAVLRMRDGALYQTDNGNWVADCGLSLEDPGAVARWLDSIPGVLGHGLFLDEVDALYHAAGSVVSRLERENLSG